MSSGPEMWKRPQRSGYNSPSSHPHASLLQKDLKSTQKWFQASLLRVTSSAGWAWRLSSHWHCSSLTGVKQEANAQAQWPTSTSAHRSPSPCAWAGSQEVLHRTSITIDQQAQGTLPWGTRWSHFITWHESCHLLLFSRVRTLLFSHEKARVTWGRFLHWSSWPAPLCHPILCVPSRGDGHRFHCNEYTVSELVRRIFFFKSL